jgi:hypothetical protein
MQCVFAFQFDDNPTFYDQICSETTIQFDRVIEQWDGLLAFNPHPGQLEFVGKTGFVR